MSCLKKVKQLIVDDGELGISLEPMQGNGTSSRVDLAYTKLFHIPTVTSVSFYTCEGDLGDSLEFCQANQGSLRVRLGTRNCSTCNDGESALISWRGGSLRFILELQREPGVYSRVTVGMAIQNWCLGSDVRTPV